jgi:hypothetical protein
MRYRIRFNKSAGQPGRGTDLHKWRVFDDNNKEYLCKYVKIHTISYTAIDPNGQDWNLVTHGELEIDRKTSTITIL